MRFRWALAILFSTLNSLSVYPNCLFGADEGSGKSISQHRELAIKQTAKRQQMHKCVQALYLGHSTRTQEGVAARVDFFKKLAASNRIDSATLNNRISAANSLLDSPEHTLVQISFTGTSRRFEQWNFRTHQEAVAAAMHVAPGTGRSFVNITTDAKCIHFTATGSDTSGSVFPMLCINPPGTQPNHPTAFFLKLLFQGMTEAVRTTFDVREAAFRVVARENGPSQLLATYQNHNVWYDIEADYLPIRWELMNKGTPVLQVDCRYDQTGDTGAVPQILSEFTFTSSGDADISRLFELRQLSFDSSACLDENLYDWKPAEGTYVTDSTKRPSTHAIFWKQGMVPVSPNVPYKESLERLKAGKYQSIIRSLLNDRYYLFILNSFFLLFVLGIWVRRPGRLANFKSLLSSR